MYASHCTRRLLGLGSPAWRPRSALRIVTAGTVSLVIGVAALPSRAEPDGHTSNENIVVKKHPDANTQGDEQEELEQGSRDLQEALERLGRSETAEEIKDALSDLSLYDDSAIVEVSKYLHHADPTVVESAAGILEIVGGEVAVMKLEEALKLPLSSENKVRCLSALLYLRHDGDVFPGLTTALGDADPEVREHAALFLGQLGEDRALPVLRTQQAKETSVNTQEAIRWAIAFLSDETSEGPKYLQSSDQKRE